MFDGRLGGIRVQKLLAADLPAVHADPDAIKRAIANLVDNAAEALQQSMVKEIVISTAAAGMRDMVEITVSDTRPRRHSSGEGKAVPAIFLDQEARHRTGAGHREPHHRRPSWFHPRGGELSHRDSLYRRVTCSVGSGGIGRTFGTTCTPS